MNHIYSMLQLFGERFVFCDDDQAQLDAAQNRDRIVDTFASILRLCELYTNEFQADMENVHDMLNKEGNILVAVSILEEYFDF